MARQRERLEREGVQVVTLAGGGGEKVDLRVYGWFPEQLDLDARVTRSEGIGDHGSLKDTNVVEPALYRDERQTCSCTTQLIETWII